MGKIYDALKKAEREALLRREKSNLQVLPLPAQSEHVETSPRMSMEKPAVKNEHMLTGEQDSNRAFHGETKKHFTANGADLLLVLQEPHSFIAEQFKILRTRLFHLTKNRTLRTILVTSTLPGEGKTTIASNLAVSIAQGFNEHVILIDTDLRKPSVEKTFGLSSSHGLTDYLGNNHALADVLQHSGIEKLSIITTGAIPENPSALIASEKMRQLIQEIKSHYQDHLIILDSSPVHQTSEPRILGEAVDGIILVVRSGMTNRELIRDTVNTLGKEKILGIVFNQSKEVSKSYYNYSYYPQLSKSKR